MMRTTSNEAFTGILSSFPLPPAIHTDRHSSSELSSHATRRSSYISTTSTSSHQELSNMTLDLIHSFQRLDTSIDDSTILISTLLRKLLKNASERVSLTHHLSDLKELRARSLQGEFNAQQKSRELLTEARREMSLQERWSMEVKVLLSRAEQEGLDISGEPDLLRINEGEESTSISGETVYIADWEAQLDQRIEKRQSGSMLSTEDQERQEKEEMFRRQLYYLTSATALSETRTKRLLSLLSSSSTANVTRAELTRLHALSVRASTSMELLTDERSESRGLLQEEEERRWKEEERRDRIVLDLVLIWKGVKERRTGRREGVFATNVIPTTAPST